MGWLVVLLGLIATYGSYAAGQGLLTAVAATVTIANIWSYGLMHNAAVESAKQRSDYGGGFGDFTDHDANAVPNWLAGINFATALVITLLLVGMAIWRWI